jgi:hypothetical protein
MKIDGILVLSENPAAPLNLITDGDAVTVQEFARRLASFLHVPLVEEAGPTDGPPRPEAPGAGGERPAAAPDEISRTPLSSGIATVARPVLRLVSSHALILRPRLTASWTAVFWLLPVVVLFLPDGGTDLGGMLRLLWQAGHALPLGFVLLLLTPLVLYLRPLVNQRVRFDRRTGLLTLGWFGRKGRRRLGDVRAVQLLPGGLAPPDSSTGFLGVASRGGPTLAYQINLVLEGPGESRLNLTNWPDWEWTRRAGQRLADFLQVPLADQVSEAGPRV